MVFAHWSPIYETGHPDIDQQHKRLFQMINELQDGIRKGRGRATMGPVLKDLASYAIEHFATEEVLMRAMGYPDLEGHKAKHDELTRQVNELVLRFSEGYLTLPSTLSRFLADWLKHHIQEQDMGFITWMREQRP